MYSSSILTNITYFSSRLGKALGLNNEQATNALSNNCAMVLKHAAARKCRFLPLEVISRMDFALRFPEINMDDSQSNFKMADVGLPGGLNSDADSLARFGLDEEEVDENDEDDDVVPSYAVAISASETQDMDSSILDAPSADIDCDDDQDGLQIYGDEEVDPADNDENEMSSFALGDSFISFSNPPSSSSKKRSCPETFITEDEVSNSSKVDVASIPLVNATSSVRIKKLKKIKVTKSSNIKKKV